MCYPKPGPRCTTHAVERLQKAREDYSALNPASATRLAKAYRDYELSPAGIKETHRQADEAERRGDKQLAEQLRARALNHHEYRKSMIELSKRVEAVKAQIREFFERTLAAINEKLRQGLELTTAEQAFKEAADPATAPRRLAELANHPKAKVRTAVAYHRSTPTETLALLSEDTHDDVRSGVSHNPNTDSGILNVLARDDHYWVRSGVADNPRTEAEALNVLSSDRGEQIRMYVADHPNTAPKTLVTLTQDRSKYVRSVAVQHIEDIVSEWGDERVRISA